MPITNPALAKIETDPRLGGESQDATVSFHTVSFSNNSHANLDSIILKQEKMDIKMETEDVEMTPQQMSTIVVNADSHASDMANLEAIQAELDRLQQGPRIADSLAGSASGMGAAGQAFTVLAPGSAASSISHPSHVKMVSLSNSAFGAEQLTSQGANIVLTTNNSQGAIAQALAKRPAPEGDNQKQVVTKVIISKNPAGGQQYFMPAGTSLLSSSHTGQTANLNQFRLSQPGGLTQRLQVPGSPTKAITLTQSNMGSPQKLKTFPGTPVTPTKKIIPAGRMIVSQAKTPPKVTMIPLSSLGRSPQKIAPQPGQFVVLGRSASTTSTSQTMAKSGTGTIPMSPSKVVLKGQAVPNPEFVVTQSLGTVTSHKPIQPQHNIPSNVQPLSVSGSKFQYVRLVTTPSSQQTTQQVSKPPTIAPAPQRQLASVAGGPVKIAVPANPHQTVQVSTGIRTSQVCPQQQRLILPATSQVLGGHTMLTQPPALTPRPAATTLSSANQNLAALAPGATINLQTMQGLPQGFALIPAQFVQQLPQQMGAQPAPVKAAESAYHQVPTATATRHSLNGSSAPQESQGARPRKPCNCTKSQCLKLYCDCFANGEFCHNCNCNNCYNNLEHEEERQRSIKTCLERNPHAFHPKIGKGRAEGDRRHNKGCNCKRSGCLKNYCECYEAKILCTALCKCVGCKNFEESPDRKTLMHLADAAEVRVQQQTAAKTKLSSQIQDLPARPPPQTSGERLPYTFVTTEVAEATCACLIAHAEEAERTRQNEIMEERMLLQEFGRCLMQVIQSANKTKAPSPVP